MSHNLNIYVFNDDFINDNMQFLSYEIYKHILSEVTEYNNKNYSLYQIVVNTNNINIEEEERKLNNYIDEIELEAANAYEIYIKKFKELNDQIDNLIYNKDDGIQYNFKLYGDKTYNRKKINE
jgi:hypothetical protein